MTLEDLVDLSSEEWDKLSDADLHKLCQNFFNVTRPDQARKSAATRILAQAQTKFKPEQQKKALILESMGVDMSFMKRKKK